MCDLLWTERHWDTFCFRLPVLNPPTAVLSLINLLSVTIQSWLPSLWCSGQSYWLQIHRSGLDSRRYQIFWDVASLERGPLSHVSTNEELLERASSGSGLENREYGRRNQPRWPRDTPLSARVGTTSLTSGGHWVGIVRSQTKATEFSCIQSWYWQHR
jgi:hypothetical protein